MAVQLEFDFEDPQEQLLTVDEIFERASEQLLTRLKEDNRIERKSARFMGESLGVYFSMWANTSPDGGLIVLGLADDGSIEGCSGLDQATVNKIEKTGFTYCADAKHTFKRIEVRNNSGGRDFLIMIRVFYNPDTVVKTSKGDAYVRRADSKHKLSADEMRELAADKGQISFEEQPCHLCYPDEFDVAAIDSWAANVRKRMGSGDGLSSEELMANRHLGLIRNGTFTPNHACALVFARDPRKLIPGCKIRFLRFDGESEGTGEKYNAVKDVWIEGNIPSIISQSETVIGTQLRTFSPLRSDGKFYPVDEYPKLAWYEAVVNACVHRSYGNGMKNMDVFVKMFDDRLEIESPGPFPPFVSEANIYEMHQPRNPRLMEALFFLNLVKMNREGTRRMRETMVTMELPAPEFAQKQIGYSLVRVTLRNNIKHRRVWVDQDVSRIVGEALVAAFTEEEKRILNWVAEYGTITVSDAQKVIRTSWQYAKKTLLALTRKRVLQYVRFVELGQRDQKAHFRLRSTAPLPDGAFESDVDPESDDDV